MGKIKYLFLIAVLFLFALTIRVYKLDSIPAGLQTDDASIAYNAYSILKTGRDEDGKTFPIIFKSFGDQKMPIAIYSLVPSIKMFGLNNIGVRLPPAIAGSLIVVLMFLILNELGFTPTISFIGASLVAVSPWSLILSRIFGYESNWGLLFFTSGILFFLLWFKKNKLLYVVLAVVSFVLTWYCYIAYRMVAPLTIILMLFTFGKRKNLIKQGSMILLGFFLLVFPLIKLSFSGQGIARFSQISTIPLTGIVLNINENRSYCGLKLPKILCYSNANKLLSYSQTLLYRSIKTFSPNYLFLEGEKDFKYINVDNYGLFYIFLLPFYLIAIVYFGNRLLTKRLTSNELLVIGGLLICHLPAIIVDEPQKVRLSPLLPFLTIFITYGIAEFYRLMKKYVNFSIFFSCLFILILVFLIYFMINLTTIQIFKYEGGYQLYVPKLIAYLTRQDKNTQIYIRYPEETLTFYAYYNKIDPAYFQSWAKREKPATNGYAFTSDLGNLHLTKDSLLQLYCKTKGKDKNILYVTNEDLFKAGITKKPVKVIYSENDVYVLSMIYDIKDIIDSSNLDCKKILE